MMTEHAAITKPDILYAVHEGVELLGDLYIPRGVDRAPVLVAAHGGGFQLGDRKFYKHWGLIWQGMVMPFFRSNIG
jgi:acetyl esterase/lipase